MKKPIALAGCVFAFTAILLGAFGAHALKDVLASEGKTDVWQTAVDYQMWHALALFALSFTVTGPTSIKTVALLFTTGIIAFSGSLYWLALGGPGWLGPITPLGGLCLMAGWAVLASALMRREKGRRA